MSLKPAKKSDLNKSWMQPRRDRRKMIQPEYHLIVTEGTETEPPYFNAMGAVINKNYPDRINVKVEGEGDNTLNLYSKAKSLAKQSANGYVEVGRSLRNVAASYECVGKWKPVNCLGRLLRSMWTCKGFMIVL